MPLILEPVGLVRSRFTTPDSLPGGGGPADLVIDPRHAAELDGVERSSHLLVVARFHREAPGRGHLAERHRGHAARCGAFATRCPDRPNRLAVTVARLLGREGLVLRADHVDLLDGTPILDVKPYVPGWDGVFSARRRRRVRQAEVSDADLHDFLQLDLENHLGAAAATLGARTALAAVFLAVRRLGLEPRDPELLAAVNRRDVAADALMGLMGATLSSGRVAVEPAPGPLQFRFRGRAGGLELVEGPRTAASVAAPPPAFAPAFDERALPLAAPRRLSAGRGGPGSRPGAPTRAPR